MPGITEYTRVRPVMPAVFSILTHSRKKNQKFPGSHTTFGYARGFTAINQDMNTAIAAPAQLQQPPAITRDTAFCHLTPEELAYLVRLEDNLPDGVHVSDHWELYRNELEFE